MKSKRNLHSAQFTMRKASILLLLLFALQLTLTSCAVYEDTGIMPSQIKRDKFDGSIYVEQSKAKAHLLKEPFGHTLEFTWYKKQPDVIYVTVGVKDIDNIQGLSFNIGDRFITAKKASSHTRYSPNYYSHASSYSYRQFKINYRDFKSIITASNVRMKVSYIDTYSVSTFGISHNVQVNRFAPVFLSQVESIRGN